MANDFSKEERVAFEQMLEGFNDAMVISKNVNVYRPDNTLMERASDEIWRPQPYIAESIDGAAGTDISASYKNFTQLSVPVTIGYNKTVPWKLTATQLRDALQEGRLGESAKQKLASDINVAMLNAACSYGSIVVKVTAAATGFANVALIEAAMNEIGVPVWDRYLALGTRDYNGMAGDLAGKETLTGKALTAYERSFVGQIASFDTFKMDYATRLAANTATGVTINGANQYYTPKGTDLTQAGKKNVDNRFQTIAVTVTGGTIAVGNAFTIAGVNSVHHITKQDTGQLKTFRVVELVTGAGGTGTIKITPPIISDGGSTDAEAQYKNVTATPANGAAITFLNTAAAPMNPFWQRDALEIIPGRLEIDSSAGVAVMRGSTDQGLELVLQKQWVQSTNSLHYRADCLFGVANKAPEMSGIILFNQT